jgi:hypothetical protein
MPSLSSGVQRKFLDRPPRPGLVATPPSGLLWNVEFLLDVWSYGSLKYFVSSALPWWSTKLELLLSAACFSTNATKYLRMIAN